MKRISRKLNNILLLPAPLGTILLYAADGLAARQRLFARSGRPRTPERSVWVPHFCRLVESHQGLRELKALAAEGMRGWGCPPVYLECLDAAFRDIGLRARAVSVLQDFADTAREKVALPEPPRHPPAGSTRPKPERKASPSPGPSRPKPRPKAPGFKPQ